MLFRQHNNVYTGILFFHSICRTICSSLGKTIHLKFNSCNQINYELIISIHNRYQRLFDCERNFIKSIFWFYNRCHTFEIVTSTSFSYESSLKRKMSHVLITNFLAIMIDFSRSVVLYGTIVSSYLISGSIKVFHHSCLPLSINSITALMLPAKPIGSIAWCLIDLLRL